jgi:hypothetical protein
LASNSRKLLNWKRGGGERYGQTRKRRDQTRHVWIGETNASKPLMTHRERVNDIKTGSEFLSQDQHSGNLFIGYVVSGVQVA